MASKAPPGLRARQAAQRQPPPAPGAPLQAHLVAEILDRLDGLIGSDKLLGDLWIEGEVRGLSRSAAGHLYFRLSGEDARNKEVQLNCAFFARQNRGARLEQGDQVLAHGRIAIYKPRGDLQMIVDAVQPKGTGVLQAEYERIRAKLEAEGLFAPERKRPLPQWPRRIGVVTSPAGAVWHDIRNVLARRWPLVRLTLSPSAVQGEDAAETIVEGIERLRNLPGDDAPDLIIVARGGGSPADLWAYNEEPVARAIFACPIPIISAVGHETDFTIADFVADRRAPTPSAAAEIAVPDLAEQLRRVGSLAAYLEQLTGNRFEAEALRLSTLRERLERSAPNPAGMRVELHAQARALERAIAEALGSRALRIAADRSRLDALNPYATLERGYALVTGPGGGVIGSAAQVQAGDTLAIRMHDGEIAAAATAVSIGEEASE